MKLTDRRFFGLLGEVVDGNPTQEMMAAAFAATDELTEAAAKIGAVNCVYRSGDRLVGDNTDGRGLVSALAGTCSVGGASVVVLGAGGAARAIAVELGLAGAREITVVNRTAEAGRSLVDAECRYVPWDGEFAVPADVDLVVNGTSIGMLDPDERADVDLSQLGPNAVVADAVIAPRETAILADASERGLRTVVGAEMLVKQAAISFDLWTGQAADETALRGALDESLLAP
ncbi:MAG: shikimate dehydrogenase [Acidimicrobiia bacterium]